MRTLTKKTSVAIALSGAAVALGIFLPAQADDGPIAVRRVAVMEPADQDESKSVPKAKAVEVKKETARLLSYLDKKPDEKIDPVPERRPVVEVKKAKAVDGELASPREIKKSSPAALVDEQDRARSMQPQKHAPRPKKKSGRISWTERYELGPGDQLNFGLHGQPKLAKVKVPVAPDYTISYLQAKQVSVRGLTVEELRIEIARVLADYHRNPKVIVTPAVLGSKKYTVLGKVKANDTYKLDRPTTLLEAIAKAKGIVVGVRNSNATELADLKRSFVVRDGKKLPVDMEKLYRTGDMTQNVQIEPGDYIYIASNVHNECYVFGSVARPGMVPLIGKPTVMGAIAESGSYAKYAWKARVLLIRGSVGSPDARVINTREVLRGNEKDIELEPGDIVYVHKRPWSYAEEIVDVAIKAYIQAAVAVKIQGSDSVSIGL
ncbi:MAG: protein involved in polysaccharide export with SLBB domain [Pseudoalteromonas tetraodonis]|jgi:protein involved in polysaccharide export with SLBB domain